MAKQLDTHSAGRGAGESGWRDEAAEADRMNRAGYVTYEQFLDWADEDTLAEWVDGRIEMTSPASLRHQEIGQFLLTTLGLFVRLHALGEVVAPPFQMKLPHSGREPDVLFVASAHRDRLTRTYLNGPADLVVEIISPESIRRDRERKFAEYEEAGIPEYWLVDPQEERVDFYQLDGRGTYHAVPADADGVYRSRTVPGFWLRVDWLWQRPPMDAVQALLKIDGESYARHLREQIKMASL